MLMTHFDWNRYKNTPWTLAFHIILHSPVTPLPYTLIRTRRRTLSLQISREGNLIARSPLRMWIETIERFIMNKREWIEKNQKKVKSDAWRVKNKKHTSKEIQEMKDRLWAYIIPRTYILWEDKNLPKIKHIKITKSENRWGSCSAKNWLCFSYRLAEYIGTPRDNFIDAIIIHELAHLREKNHQKPFWNLVYKMMPNYEVIIQQSKVPSGF